MGEQKTAGNPYNWTNPVHDPEAFAGRREELTKVMSEIVRIKDKERINPIIAVTGERRVGKTSLLLRLGERCQEERIKSIMIPIEDSKVQSSWEFWSEIFGGLLLCAKREGIKINVKDHTPMGFTVKSQTTESIKGVELNGLMFPEACKFYLSGTRAQVSTVIIQNDLEQITNGFKELGYGGLVLLLDEAHLLLSSQGLKQQLRNAIQQVGECGIVFAGEPKLATMFSEPTEPFFGQASVIPLGNFIRRDDIIECCLLPLKPDEAKLVSPMTVQYITRLSRGILFKFPGSFSKKMGKRKRGSFLRRQIKRRML